MELWYERQHEDEKPSVVVVWLCLEQVEEQQRVWGAKGGEKCEMMKKVVEGVDVVEVELKVW